MRRIHVFGWAALLLLVDPTLARAEWVQREFILGTCWDPCLSVPGPEPYDPDSVARDSVRFLRAREAHFNLITGSQQEPYAIQESEAGMRYALSIAARTGLRYLVMDSRYHRLGHLAPWDEAVSRDLIRDYVTELDSTRRKALFGYNIGDEPCYDPAHPKLDCASQPKRFKDWVAALRKGDPDRLIYLNLLNVRAHDERLDGVSDENFFRGFVDDPDPARRASVVATDDYPFSVKYGFNEQYFENLATMRRVAGERPMWVYPLSAHLEGKVDPTPAHLRFMTFCPIAYGAKGLLYFTYERPEWTGEYAVYDAPVVDCDQYTEKYDQVREINRFIRGHAGPIVMRAQYRGTYHTGTTAAKEWLQPSDFLSSSRSSLVLSASNPNLVIGLFQETAVPASWYVFVANKTLSPQRGSITLRGQHPIVRAGPRVQSFRGAESFEQVDVQVATAPEETTFEFSFDGPLEGGEGRFFLIPNVR